MTPEENFWSFVSKDCWVWLGSTRWDGYGRLQFNGKQTTANRVAWELANGRPVPKGMCVLHTCDSPICVNPAHLRLGSHAENMQDAKRKKRTACGERARHTLTEAQVLDIRSRFKRTKANKSNIPRLAKVYGVSKGCIRDVVLRLSWAHLP